MGSGNDPPPVDAQTQEIGLQANAAHDDDDDDDPLDFQSSDINTDVKTDRPLCSPRRPNGNGSTHSSPRQPNVNAAQDGHMVMHLEPNGYEAHVNVNAAQDGHMVMHLGPNGP